MRQGLFRVNNFYYKACKMFFWIFLQLSIKWTEFDQLWSSLLYNTSARHERHECDTNDTSATKTTQVQHELDTSDTSATQLWHECYTNDTSGTRVRIFDFDNDKSEKIFSHPYISYMANERWNNFILRTTFWDMPRSHANMHLKSAPQKLNFVMAKAISKSYTLDCSCKCSCTFPHSYV